jgi:phage recombination protein Bet
MNNVAPIQQGQGQSTALASIASRLSIDPNEMQSIVMNTLVAAKKNQAVTNEELVTFLAIANEYKLNPLTKEIYAFANRGAIQPIVSIDGWLKIINSHSQFDGMEFEDSIDANGKIVAITCRIFRKDRQRHTEVTEYLNECQGTSEPWKKWPARMLRHKAAIQAARYAFGLSGIVDPDEADRINSTAERDITPTVKAVKSKPTYSEEDFKANFSKWANAITSKKLTAEQVIVRANSKAQLTDEQQKQIREVSA